MNAPSTVLIADDNARLRRMVRDVLSAPDREFVEAENGAPRIEWEPEPVRFSADEALTLSMHAQVTDTHLMLAPSFEGVAVSRSLMSRVPGFATAGAVSIPVSPFPFIGIFALLFLFFVYIIGIAIGCAMGYFGGKFDLLFQRLGFGAIEIAQGGFQEQALGVYAQDSQVDTQVNQVSGLLGVIADGAMRKNEQQLAQQGLFRLRQGRR